MYKLDYILIGGIVMQWFYIWHKENQFDSTLIRYKLRLKKLEKLCAEDSKI